MPKVIGYETSMDKHYTCKSCTAINEFTPNDLRDINTNYDYLGDYDIYKGFNCAGCGKEIFTERVNYANTKTRILPQQDFV